MTSKSEQNCLRGDGIIRSIKIEADNLAEATHNAILACYEEGARVETPKHRPGMALGYDEDINITVFYPDSEPKIYFPGIYEDGRGIMQYILEVTHGIHNHWKKNKEHPEWWSYTYNERIVDQLPFVFQRIKSDWDKKRRITGRDFHFTTWRPGEDIILEQEDPPCWQIGNLRFLKNKNEEIILNYITEWRSRDLLKAWNENCIGQVALMKLFAAKVSDMLGIEIKLGSYIDKSTSLHLYGLYVDRDGLDNQIEQMKETPYKQKSMSLEDYFSVPDLDDAESLKRLIAAQMDAELKGYGLNQSKQRLIELGYDLDNFSYPEEWDTYPESWNAEPNRDLLARVI